MKRINDGALKSQRFVSDLGRRGPLAVRLAASVAACWVLLAADALAVEVVCHRGANEVAPENTLAAAKKCIEWGVDYVEVDVRTSKDGQLYILHDPFVNRTTNGKGFLRNLTAEQIDQLDAGSWFDPKFAGEKVPALAPYLRSIKGKVKIYFDVKDADLKQLIELVYEVGLDHDCFFWFDNSKRALEFRKLNKELALKVNASTPEKVNEAYERYGANIIEAGLGDLNPEMLAACHDRGLKLMILQTKKDPEAFRKIIEGGADMVNLDHADLFLKVQRELKTNP